jgi:hypothetical protein
MIPAAAISSAPSNCHSERSLAVSQASPQTESKDPYPANAIRAEAGNSRVVAPGEHDTVRQQHPSREAAGWESPAPFGFTEGSLEGRVASPVKNESCRDATLAADTQRQ